VRKNVTGGDDGSGIIPDPEVPLDPTPTNGDNENNDKSGSDDSSKDSGDDEGFSVAGFNRRTLLIAGGVAMIGVLISQ
jgi:hypothetical protein